MSTQERRITRCKACQDTFSYRYELAPEQEENLIVHTTCPFCKTPLRIDLNPYARSKLISYRNAEGANEAATITLELPEELPSTVEE